jgi:hypothetical protein
LPLEIQLLERDGLFISVLPLEIQLLERDGLFISVLPLEIQINKPTLSNN